MSTLHDTGPPQLAVDAIAVLARTVDLVNVCRTRRADPRTSAPTLEGVLRRHGEVIESSLTQTELRQCAAVLRELAGVMETDDVDAAAGALNVLLARYGAAPRLIRHAGWPWHLHLDGGEDEPWHRWMGATGAFALATRLAGRTDVPWGVCAAEGCEQVFVHDDRGARRRHCSSTCGTRVRVARYRDRRRPDAGALRASAS